MDRKNQKIAKILPIFLGGPMGPIHPVWALAAIHPRWGNRYTLPEMAASDPCCNLGDTCQFEGSERV